MSIKLWAKLLLLLTRPMTTAMRDFRVGPRNRLGGQQKLIERTAVIVFCKAHQKGGGGWLISCMCNMLKSHVICFDFWKRNMLLMPRDKRNNSCGHFRPRELKGIAVIYGNKQHIPTTWTTFFFFFKKLISIRVKGDTVTDNLYSRIEFKLYWDISIRLYI